MDAMLSTQRGQTLEDHARDIEGVLNWFRQQALNQGFDREEVLFTAVPPRPLDRSSPEERMRDLKGALNWL